MSVQLIICGMHRSGTSLVANVLREAGLDIGTRDDVGLGVGQPRGHFEDRDFFRLHEAMLAASGRSCFTADEGSLATAVTPAFEEQARALIAARADRPFWGWKDPRTCLFLDLWDRLLPQARHLFLYRHPVDVALSLWRRNTDPELSADPWLALRVWELYNRRLLALRDRHPERCFVAHAPALAADLGGFVRRVADKLNLPLHGGDFRSLFDADELAPSCQPPRPAWEELIPEAMALYRRLEEVADLPSAEEAVDAADAADTAGANGRQRGLLKTSETLLYKLLEAHLDLRLQEKAAHRNLRLQEEDLQKRLAAATAEAVEAGRVLREIERSRSFALIRGWWSLRRRMPL